MRLINADELRDDILHDSEYDNDTINHFLDLIDCQPVIENASIVHGYWECNRHQAIDEKPYCCSVCNEGESEYGLDDYCPKCGARMDRKKCVNDD